MTNSCEHRLGNKTNNMDLRQSYLLYMDEDKLFYIIKCSSCHQRKKLRSGIELDLSLPRKRRSGLSPRSSLGR